MITLRKVAEDASSITLGWDAVPGADGFRFTAEKQPKSSHTWDGARRSIKFSKGSAWYKVEALNVQDEGIWTGDEQPPPTGWTVAPPQGQLTDRNGGGTQSHWRFDYTVGPILVEKQHIHDYTSYGYGYMQWPAAESPPNVRSTIRDLRVERISRVPPRASDGTAEAGVWGGQTGDHYRFDIASCAWMQIWTGARCYRSTWSDIRMRDTRLVGIYPEHQTWDTTFRRFINEESPGQLANTVNQEWAYGGEFSKNLVYDQFDLYVPKNSWAFFIDAGNGGTQIAPSPGSRIWGPGNGVIFPKRIWTGVGPNRVWMENIDMSQLAGTKYAEHDNAIGSFPHRVASAMRGWVGLAPKLHPATQRMPVEMKQRMADLVRIA